MGFALQSLLFCGFCRTSSVCWLNMTAFEFVMVSIIPGNVYRCFIGICKFHFSSLDKRMSGLVESLNT